MRYYAIKVYGAPAAFTPTPDGMTWTSHPNGQLDPNAQQIEFNIEELRPNLPHSDSTLTIHGVSFQQIKQTADLNGLPIAIWGGMMDHSLPIANHQARNRGLLMNGMINKCWGNWVGTEMSIGMQFAPGGLTQSTFASTGSANTNSSSNANANASASGAITTFQAQQARIKKNGPRSLVRRPFSRGRAPGLPTVNPLDGFDIGSALGSIGGAFGAGGTSDIGGMISSFFGGGNNGLQNPLNIIHNLLPNMPLSAAIQQTLSTAFPNGQVNILISNLLKLAYQDAGVYQNLQQYATYINKLSQNILGVNNNQLGVQFSSHSNVMNVWDGSVPVTEGTISILDLIGQPTWIGPQRVSIKTVLRADLWGGSFITLPPTLMTVSPEAIIPGLPEQRTNSSFAGTFVITRVLLIGDFRNPDGVGWSTNYEAAVQPGTGGVGGFTTSPGQPTPEDTGQG